MTAFQLTSVQWLGLAVVSRLAYSLAIQRSGDSARLHADVRTAALSYFMGRGLSELQVRVAWDIFEGKTGSEIARELAYSPRSVNVARRKAYQMLRIHSALELRALIQDDVPAVHG